MGAEGAVAIATDLVSNERRTGWGSVAGCRSCGLPWQVIPALDIKFDPRKDFGGAKRLPLQPRFAISVSTLPSSSVAILVWGT